MTLAANVANGVRPLPGVLDPRAFERARVDLGRCDICKEGKAVYRSRAAQANLCEGCYSRLVRERNGPGGGAMRGQARPAPPCSVVEADCQVVVVREFVPEVEHERAVVQEVAGDDVVRIDVPDFFNSFGGSHKHLHGVTSVLWSLMRQGWGCLSRGAGLSTAEGLRWRGENLVGLGWGPGGRGAWNTNAALRRLGEAVEATTLHPCDESA